MNKTTIRELCPTMHSGGTPSTKHPEYWNGTIPWLSSAESGNEYICNATQFITQEGVDNSSTRYAEKGSVVIATAGEGKTRGQVSFLEIGAYINQSLIAMKTDETKVLTKYLYYYLKNSYRRLRSLSDVTGVRGSLSGSLLGDFEISYPDLETQEKIVLLLSSIDSKISNNISLCNDIEEMTKLLYNYWFVQFDFPNKDRNPYKSNGGEMVWNEKLKMDIPAGWKVSCLNDCCSFENGDRSKNYPSGNDFLDSGIPFIAGGALTDKTIDPSDIRFISEEKYASLRAGKAQKGDLLMTLRGSLAKCVFSPYPRAAIASALVIVRPLNMISNEYLHSVITSDYYVQLLKNYNNGSVQANLSVDSIGPFPVIIPSEEIMKEYTKAVETNRRMIDQLREEVRSLDSLRRFLLPMLMNGQINFLKST